MGSVIMSENENKLSKDIFVNRELSWLEFNKRVLNECDNANNPLFEQLKFLAIYGSNLDEFFMVRIGTLVDQMIVSPNLIDNKTGMNLKEQLNAAISMVKELTKEKDAMYKDLMKKLSKEGIKKVNLDKLSSKDLQAWKSYFMSELMPLLSPQVIDKRHPYPFLQNCEQYIYIRFKQKNGGVLFGVVPVPTIGRGVVWNKEKPLSEFTTAVELIYKFIDIVFSKYKIDEKIIFRVTRNADINPDEGVFKLDTDYRSEMTMLIKKRKKLAPVRLQVSQELGETMSNHLTDQLGIEKNDIYVEQTPLDLKHLMMIESAFDSRNYAQFYYEKNRAVKPEISFYKSKVFEKNDQLMFFPFQSFDKIIDLIDKAADDPDVVSIKITLYRVSNDSKIISALIKAAEKGKQVLAIIELRARFDEENNIEYAELLEEAGCTVIYGLGDYKVHAKLILITKKTGNKLSHIGYVGTGNFNEKTASLYTDIGFVTSKQKICLELLEVFNSISCGELPEIDGDIFAAPIGFKSQFIKLIELETDKAKEGLPAEINIKCNSISDYDIITKLVEASVAGVKVTMYIRGICCLQSGVFGLTDNIRVISIVGRYLEHSRIFCFGTGTSAQYFISSGDFLTRNTERRIEVAVRVNDNILKEQLKMVFEYCANDNMNANLQIKNGQYRKLTPSYAVQQFNSQQQLFDRFNTIDAQSQKKEKSGLRKFFTNLFYE